MRLKAGPTPVLSIDDVIATDELARRPARAPDHASENRAILALAKVMAESPGAVLEAFCASVLDLCRAGSAGVSVLEKDEDGSEVFRWHAIAGALAANVRGTVPRDRSPCGVVLERNEVTLFAQPLLCFQGALAADPPVIETLTVPLYDGDRPIGTVWAVSHDPGRGFDAEDARLLSSLSWFASSALKALEQKKREVNTAREDELRSRIILESITDAFFALGPDWRFTYVNAEAERLLGHSRHHLEGKILWDEFAPALGTEFERSYRRAMDERVTARFEAFYPPHDRWYEVHAYPSTSGLSVYFRDINDRKRVEERERRAALHSAWAAGVNAKFRTMFEQGTQFAGILSVDGTVVEANRLCLDACGFRREEVIGKPFWECGWWNRSPALIATIRPACEKASAGQLFRAEIPYFIADGSERMVDLVIAPAIDDAGRVLFIATTGTDITDRKLAEKELMAANRRKDEFLALLAHELRNPLAPLRNGLELMRLASDDPGVLAKHRDMMERQLAHMVRLIDDLLDISRISRNKLELRRERVLLADIVATAVETARPVIDAAGHTLSVALPATPLELDADLTRLAQVFGNLLTNAAKYTDRGGRILLTAERRASEVTVSVSDTGIGIPAAALPTIFEMFSQVDRTIERSTGGLGIGLALVRGLTEMHGGRVTAESGGVGAGSTFTVTLPLVDAPRAVSAPALAEDPDAHRGPARRVLVVDDNVDSAETMAEMLVLLGHDVRTAHDGIDAVEAAEAFRPELILMDIGMPRLNGYDATRRIREQSWGKAATIVALTGWGQQSDRAQSRLAGCDSHLVKPVRLEDVEPFLSPRAAG